MKLNDKEWKEFKISDVFSNAINSKAYHAESLLFDDLGVPYGVPYITRTNNDNGLFGTVKNTNFNLNPECSISFGAENATYFYQPYKFITGNKMYYYHKKQFNKYVCLFIITSLNKGLRGCGFGYAMGLTGKRSDSRRVLLPIDSNDNPDYKFMEEYMREKETKLLDKYLEYAETLKKSGGGYKLIPLNLKEWRPFYLINVFNKIRRGKRLKKDDHIDGNIPYVSSSFMDNGVDGFVSNKKCKKFYNCLSIANSGSVGSTFFHPYEFVASDHVTELKNEQLDKYSYLFIASLTKRLSQKYNFNREINDYRIKRERIMLPVNDSGNPDYEYMSYYMINHQYNQITKFMKIIN